MFGAPFKKSTKKIEFGAAVQLSAASGNILAVGAPHHSYNSSTPNPANINEDGGAIFLYKYAETNWNLLSFFSGKSGEQIGDHLSLSADGSRIAIRRYLKNTTNHVEVHTVATNGATSKLGSNLSCGAKGNSVALSSNGNRVAVSCHAFNVGRGRVEIFEWKADIEQWTSIGQVTLIDTGNTNAFFGWSVSFANSGSRLAVSAPNFDAEGVTNRGMVRVYDYVGGTTWAQVGVDILGLTAEEQFGFSMDMSENGLSVVAGAPQSSGIRNVTSSGAVSVFGLDSATRTWNRVGNLVAGQNTFDRFGRSVSISGDGQRIAASSYLANGGRGVVKVLDFEGDEWTSSGELIGTSNQERLGLGLKSVTLTSDGSRIASGVVWSNNTDGVPTGRVLVFDDIIAPSSTPSTTPSLSPSALPTPSPSHSPSLFLTGSSSPATSPSSAPNNQPSATETSIPTIKLSKFDWDLERSGDAFVSFSDSTNTGEITLNYYISNRRAVITILDESCVTPVPSSIIGVTSKSTVKTSTHSNLQVALDVKQDTVVTSSLWRNGESGVGFVNFCVRVDLVLDNDSLTSVNFHEQKINITIGLQQGFSVVSINLARDAAEEIAKGTDVEYNILACQCNENFVCVNEVLVQGSDVFICVYSNTTDVQVAGISALTFRQGSFTISPIVNFTEDAITAVSVSAQGALIRSQMRSDFFAAADPGDMLAEGVAVLSFSAQGRRQLRVVSLSRMLQGIIPGQTYFSVTMG